MSERSETNTRGNETYWERERKLESGDSVGGRERRSVGVGLVEEERELVDRDGVDDLEIDSSRL